MQTTLQQSKKRQPALRSLAPAIPHSTLDETGAPVGVQQKLMCHAHPSTTLAYGNALMKSKREANSKVVRMALRSADAEVSVP